ncbi:MAG TPA: hypothetical protein PKH04_07040 [Burkholderiaceae bacterium]|nr:hypothetical protein [Burkholderiaceae bacterium]HPW08029.1 hypothetical protein [Burkholderiaceae bacterium]
MDSFTFPFGSLCTTGLAAAAVFAVFTVLAGGAFTGFTAALATGFCGLALTADLAGALAGADFAGFTTLTGLETGFAAGFAAGLVLATGLTAGLATAFFAGLAFATTFGALTGALEGALAFPGLAFTSCLLAELACACTSLTDWSRTFSV